MSILPCIDCDTTGYSIEAIFKKLLACDEDGNFQLRVYQLLLASVLDEGVDALRTLSHLESEIHEGHAYSTSDSFVHGMAASPNILIVAPDTDVDIHLFFEAISDDVVTVDFYEGADYSGGGALLESNRNRKSANAATVVCTSDATDDGGGKGTSLWTFGGGANKTVTSTKGFAWILKRNEKYLIETVGVNADIITILIDWIEHT